MMRLCKIVLIIVITVAITSCTREFHVGSTMEFAEIYIGAYDRPMFNFMLSMDTVVRTVDAGYVDLGFKPQQEYRYVVLYFVKPPFKEASLSRVEIQLTSMEEWKTWANAIAEAEPIILYNSADEQPILP